MTFLSIVIPAYNEATAIKAGKLNRIVTWLGQQSYDSEVIVVDDGSKDNTAELARSIANQMVCIPHAGKAAAIMAGIQRASGEIILFTDMDQATPITEATNLIGALNQGDDIAIGSRGLVRTGAPPGRYLLSWGHMALRKVLLGIKIMDSQCGFKALRCSVVVDVLRHLCLYHPNHVPPIHGPSVTSGFDVEFLFVAHRLGYRIREVPVTWHYQETRRVSLIKDMWRGINDLFNILRMDLKGLYPKHK